MTEEDLHISIAEWIALKANQDPRYLGFWHTPNGGLRSKATAAKLKRMGVKPGVPDWVNPCKSNGFNGLAVELKKPGKNPTKDQGDWLIRLRSYGWRCAVCSDYDAFVRNTEEYFLEKAA